MRIPSRNLIRALALLAAFAVALPAAGLGQLLYFCSMTGEVGPSCCCGHQEVVEASVELSLDAPPCCELVDDESAAPPSGIESLALKVFPGAVVFCGHQSTEPLRSHASALAMRGMASRAPPDRGPPLYLDHCTYLI